MAQQSGSAQGEMTADQENIEAMAERVARSEGLELVAVEIKGGKANPLLRIYIDKPGGVTHGDCQRVSEQLSAMLDVEDPFPGSYLLEVSSPGLDRQLGSPREYAHFAGRRVRISFREPDGERRVLEGKLAGIEGDQVSVEADGGGVEQVALAKITKARLVPEF